VTTTIAKLGGPASSQHILVADAVSGSSGLELSPLGSVYIAPDERGVLVHTNHFLVNKLVDEPPWLESSPVRLERAKVLCDSVVTAVQRPTKEQAEFEPRVSPALLRDRIFADGCGTPLGISCRSKQANDTVSGTLFNIVMQFETRKTPFAEVLFGGPGPKNRGPVLRMPW